MKCSSEAAGWPAQAEVGDEDGVLAIAGRIEVLPFNAQAIALVETEDPANGCHGVMQAQLQIHWVKSDTVNALAQAVTALKLPATSEEGFAWAAGEAASMVAQRQALDTAKTCEG